MARKKRKNLAELKAEQEQERRRDSRKVNERVDFAKDHSNPIELTYKDLEDEFFGGFTRDKEDEQPGRGFQLATRISDPGWAAVQPEGPTREQRRHGY